MYPATLIMIVAIFAAVATSIPRSHEEESGENSQKRQVCEQSTPNFTAADAATLVALHNQLRASEPASGMFAVEWSDDLARRAQAWSDYLASTDTFAHGYQTTCTGEKIGQNLWTASSSTASNTKPWTDAVRSWYNETFDYTFSTKTCAAGKQCGHYTQVVWDSSRYIGCGIRSYISYKSGTWYKQVVTCNYSPAGNSNNQSPYTIGTRGTTCTSTSVKPTVAGVGWKVRPDGLCDFCQRSTDASCNCYGCVNGTLSANTCTCACNTGYNGLQCQNNCIDRKGNGTCNSWLNLCPQASYYKHMQENCPCYCIKNNLTPGVSSMYNCCAL